MANGSKGWDGIATSMALPEYWPAGTVYEIAFWTPNRFDAAFDPNHGGEAAVEVEQVTGTSYVLPPDPMRLGARFASWWTAPENGARVTASMQVTATRPASRSRGTSSSRRSCAPWRWWKDGHLVAGVAERVA